MKRNIKKTAVAFFAAAAVFAMGSVSTFAAEPGCGRYYEDADQDASATVMVKQDSGKLPQTAKGTLRRPSQTGKSRQKTWMPFLNNREKAG